MRTRDLIELLALAAIWGGSFLFLRVSTPEIGSLLVAAVRVAGGALLLMPLVVLAKDVPALRRHWRQLAVASLLSCILPFMGLGQASRTLPAGVLSILNATTPMWAALVGWIWSGERLAAMRAGGLAMSFAGVALLASGKGQISVEGGHAAALLALGSTLMYAFAVHYNKRYLSELRPLSNCAGTLAMASLFLVLPALWIGPQPAHPGRHASADLGWHWGEVSVQAWLALAALTLVCTGFAYLIFYRLIDRIGASRALTVTFLIPVFGMLWGAMFLGEHVTPLMVLSTGIILFGTYLSNHGAGLPEPVLKEARS